MGTTKTSADAAAHASAETGVAGLSPDEAWAAVSRRDPSLDDRLFYAVTTTGVYCRPSCAARRPRRDRVRFFDTAEAAERAGFRACKRCRPGESGPGEGELRVREAAAFLEAHPEERVTLAELAAEVGLSPGHLQRTFTRVFGRSPRLYQNALRAQALKDRLKAGVAVSDAGYEAGYGSSRALYENATRELGMSPARYRRGGEGLTIRYAVADSPLGRVLVGTTERGVCCVFLGDRDDALERELAREFPRAERRRDDTRSAWVRAAVERVSGATSADFPLDAQGTEFQRRVWAALRQVPAGSTVSYGAVAEGLGEPRAARAVAGACASNHLAVLVPCHRVVRGDGGLGDYKWGVERKRALLEREGRAGYED